MAKKTSGARNSWQTQPNPTQPLVDLQTDKTPCNRFVAAANLQSVDSWRSYTNDQTNLQSAMGGQTRFKPTADPFVPNNSLSQPPHLTSHQPLRLSNGAKERHMPGNTKHLFNSKYNFQVYNTERQGSRQTGPTSSVYQSRWATLSDPDQPVPSIETPETDTLAPGRPNGQREDFLRRSTPRRSHTVSPPPAPAATQSYKFQANKSPKLLKLPRKLLIILDLNGTLLYRPDRANNPTNVNIRPGVTTLLQYLFENHVVMVYTSARPDNAAGMVNNFLHPNHRRQLAAVWARDKLDLTPAQYYGKVQVYKNLDKVWNDLSIQRTAAKGQKWDQSNTVLVDDSKLKALAQPHNLLQVTEYTKIDNPLSPRLSTPEAQTAASKVQQDILKQLELKLEELKWQEDVSRLIREWQSGKTPVPRVPGQEIVVEETVDQKILQELREKAEQDQQKAAQTQTEHLQLLTPRSSDEGNLEKNHKVNDGTTTAVGQPDYRGKASVTLHASHGHKDPIVHIPGLELLDGISIADGLPAQSPVAKGEEPEISPAQARSVSPIDPNVWLDILQGTPDKAEKPKAKKNKKNKKP